MPSPKLSYKSNFTATLFGIPPVPGRTVETITERTAATPSAAVELPCSAKVKPSAVFRSYLEGEIGNEVLDVDLRRVPCAGSLKTDHRR